MESFSIAPAAARTLWLLPVLLALVLVPVFVLVSLSVAGSRNARFEVSPDGLRLRGDLYGRTIPAGQIHASAARRIDLAAEPALAPRSRTMGTGLPGYQSGWFRLRNGERALLYLTDRTRAVYVPTTAGYSLLLSPAEPDKFIATLQAVGR